MKALLIVTAVFEAATGLSLAIKPTLTASLLLGAALDTPAALVVARVAGAALIVIAVACWAASGDTGSSATKGLVAALLLYNVAALAVLVHARLGLGLSTAALTGASALHAALAVWCGARLQAGR